MSLVETYQLIMDELETFAINLDEYMQQNPDVALKVRKSVTQKDLENMAAKQVANTYCITDEDFEKGGIETMDMMATFHLRGVPKGDMAKCMPASLKTQEMIEILRNIGTTTLADLCAFHEPAAPKPINRTPKP